MRNTPYYIHNLSTSPIADGHKGRPCKGLMRLQSLNGILLCLLLLLAGCSDKFLDSIDTGSDVPDGTPVVIDGTFSSGASDAVTRAMGEIPDITSMYAIVFDENDLLSEIAPCLPGTYEHPQTTFTPDGDPLYHTPFHVVLQSSAKRRIVHLVANVEPQSYAITDEVTLMKNLVVNGTTDAYWRRIDLDNGIAADAMGKVKDETLKHFNNITLVRNFAKIGITVDESLKDNFHLAGYYIFNQPATGTVAPYNLNATYDLNTPTADRFAQYVTTDDTKPNAVPVSASYFDLNDTQRYYGYEPSQMKLKDNPPVSADGSNDAAFPFVAPSQPTYMYESTYTNGASDNPFIILKAKYRSDTSTDWANITPTYYKADFVYTRDTDKGDEVKYQYNYNVLRNLSYSLDITNVNGEGRKSIQEAINYAPMNNFMMSSESQDLTNIAADKARLYVDWTDELFTSGGTHPLKVKFIYDKDNPTTTISNWKKDETGNPNPKYYVNAKLEPLDAGLEAFIKDVTWDGTGNSNDADGYRTLNINFLENLPNHYTRQNILITCSSGLLRRATVSYIPASQMTYTVSSDPATLPTTADAAVKLSITIPSTLTEKRFPLHFYISSTDNVLYPDVTATGFVEMPLTVTNDAGEYYYHYNRYITWSEYNAMAPDAGGTTKSFPCCFKLYKNAPNYTVTFKPSNDDKTQNYFSTSTSISTK